MKLCALCGNGTTGSHPKLHVTPCHTCGAENHSACAHSGWICPDCGHPVMAKDPEIRRFAVNSHLKSHNGAPLGHPPRPTSGGGKGGSNGVLDTIGNAVGDAIDMIFGD